MLFAKYSISGEMSKNEARGNNYAYKGGCSIINNFVEISANPGHSNLGMTMTLRQSMKVF